ncbi:transposase, partial [Prevotella sp. kh1p2]|uniref:transposase n=1 Tax=Prevotella sp. kh1p2 TaxID=1761883 RepID=UPI0008D8B16F
MKQYNEIEKLELLRRYLTSGLSIRAFSANAGIPVATFFGYLRAYGHPDNSSIPLLMKHEELPTTLDELRAQLLEERKAHEAELKRLKKELAQEKLRCLANSTMIDLAEKKFNI